MRVKRPCTRRTGGEEFLVDGREDVPLSASVKSGGLALDLDGFCFSSSEPIRLFVEDGDAADVHGVASLLHV